MRDVAVGHPDFGRSLPCPKCADFFAHSGLKEHERNLTWDSLVLNSPTDTQGNLRALEFAGKTMVAKRFGFATVFGNNGTAKSLWAKIIAAEFCRAGVTTKFVHGKAMEDLLFANGKDEDAVRESAMRLDRYLFPQVLVIDETQTINWKNQWVAGHIGQLLTERHDLATADGSQRKVTILVGQYHPSFWGPVENIAFLLSRMSEGTFALPWKEGQVGPIPQCLLTRPCSCGGEMVRDGKSDVLICNKREDKRSPCANSRPIEVYFPFALTMSDIRPILPPMIDEIDAVEIDATMWSTG